MDRMMEMVPEALRPYFEQALPVWTGGGWAMVPLALIAMIIFILGLSSIADLILSGARSDPDRAWRRWLKQPEKPRGVIGRIMAEAMTCKSLHEIDTFFQLLTSETVNPFSRRVRIMKVCVATAPLLGLLGTVTGMLITFGGLAKGGGGEQTMGIISKGISEALITTETGLVVALTGLSIEFFLIRQFQRYEKVLAHIETLCMREFMTRLKQNETGPEMIKEAV